jgi:hypothetical protein
MQKMDNHFTLKLECSSHFVVDGCYCRWVIEPWFLKDVLMLIRNWQCCRAARYHSGKGMFSMHLCISLHCAVCDFLNDCYLEEWLGCGLPASPFHSLHTALIWLHLTTVCRNSWKGKLQTKLRSAVEVTIMLVTPQMLHKCLQGSGAPSCCVVLIHIHFIHRHTGYSDFWPIMYINVKIPSQHNYILYFGILWYTCQLKHNHIQAWHQLHISMYSIECISWRGVSYSLPNFRDLHIVISNTKQTYMADWQFTIFLFDYLHKCDGTTTYGNKFWKMHDCF